MIAIALMNQAGSDFSLPLNKEGALNYNMAVPKMLAHYFPEGILGLGLTALMASFMSGMAGNVTAFNTVWTYDIYQSYIAPNRSDNHYLWMGPDGNRLRHRHQYRGGIRGGPFHQHHGICFNWSSASSTPPCSPRSCWGCFGGDRPATARSLGCSPGPQGLLSTTA